MPNEHNTKLSALIDDELDNHEFTGINRLLEADTELRATLNRYSIISETIRGIPPEIDATSIARRVSSALEHEPVLLAPGRIKQREVPAWLKPVAGAAIAASVATLAVVNITGLSTQSNTAEVFPVTAVNVKPAPVVAFSSQQLAMPAATHWKTAADTPGIEEELNRLLIDHSEYSAQAGMHAMLPYASFVSYDQK